MSHRLKYGQLSRTDILHEKGLEIYPRNEECLKSASYDITPTMVALSSKLGMLEPVYRKKGNQIADDYYIIVKPKDTVLIISREFIKMPENIAGNVTSRVSNVVKGFGHISTTIDPNWNGAILIALSNPTNIPLKINVGNRETNPLATVTFNYLNSKCDKNDNEITQKSMRVDLLNEINYKERHGIKSVFRKIIHFKRKRATDFFYEYLDIHKNIPLGESWDRFLDEFSNLEISDSSTNHFNKYVINETVLNRLIHRLNAHKVEIKSLIILVILLILLKLDIISLWEFFNKFLSL